MSLYYGQRTNPEAFIIAALASLGYPVGPERPSGAPTPAYMVTALPGTEPYRGLTLSLVSVSTFAASRADASTAAWAAHDLLISLTPGDLITLPDGSAQVGAWVDPRQTPTWDKYSDPDMKRYHARYLPILPPRP